MEEPILNGTMVKIFGCPRSRNAHIERKKSKCDYILPCCPTDEQVAQLEATVNEVIGTAYPVWTGIGAVGTVLLGILVFKEPATFWRMFFTFTLIASIIGLKVVQ